MKKPLHSFKHIQKWLTRCKASKFSTEKLNILNLAAVTCVGEKNPINKKIHTRPSVMSPKDRFVQSNDY